jgi:hypothetical protein
MTVDAAQLSAVTPYRPRNRWASLMDEVGRTERMGLTFQMLAMEAEACSLGRLLAVQGFLGSQISDDPNGFAERKASSGEVFQMDLRHREHYHLGIADDHIEPIEGHGRSKVVAFRLLVLIAFDYSRDWKWLRSTR